MPRSRRTRANPAPGDRSEDPDGVVALGDPSGGGSARSLARLCEREIGFVVAVRRGRGQRSHLVGFPGRISGSDFRIAPGDLLARLLNESVAALCGEGLASLDRLSLDGVRIPASAGAASSRRHPSAERCRKKAEQLASQREPRENPAAAKRAAAEPKRGLRGRCGRWVRAKTNAGAARAGGP